jgi:hypothetical protein
MKISLFRILTVPLLAAFAALSAPAHGSFEGKVSYTLKQGRDSLQMDYSIKGEQLRIDMKGGAEDVSTIMDTNGRKMTILMPSQQMYMVMDFPSQANAPTKRSEESEASEAGGGSGRLERTDETAEIAGFTARRYLAKADDGRQTVTEIWASDELGSFFALGGGPGASQARTWEGDLSGANLFPLRVVERDARGRENFRLEAQKIEKKSLSDSIFQPPANYQLFQMPNIPGMPFRR